MATTYRYMSLATPTTVGEIQNQIPTASGPVSITVPPPIMIDVEVTNPSAEAKLDLDAYMTSIGWSFMEEDPPAMVNGETIVWENGAWVCQNMAAVTVSSSSEDSTTKSNFIRKVRNSFTVLKASSKHIILYDALIESSASNGWCEVQVILDDVTVLASLKQKPGGGGMQLKFSGHIDPTPYGLGAHTIDIEYKKFGGGGSVKIKEAKITTWRVF